MKFKVRYIVMYFRLLSDMSAIRMAKEWPLQGGVKLSPLVAFLDSLWCKLRYGIRTREYFYYALYNKSGRARRQFVGEAESAWTLAYIINRGDKELFSQKWNTYQAYQPYFRREMALFNLPADEVALKEFGHIHGGFIIKPIKSTQGYGIRFYDNKQSGAERILESICSEVKGKVVVEELIEQDDEMAVFHPSSVNTVRYVVDYRPDGTTDALYSIIRMGIGENRIDNTHAGGLCAAIDLETGIIVSCGIRQNGETYLKHPDTGKQIIGAQIPRWNELQALVERLRPEKNTTGVRLVGWDFALMPEGWCIVEGNAGPSMRGIQGCTGIGYRSLLKRVRNGK